MRGIAVAFSVMLTSAVSAGAQPLICFGNEPSWSVTFSTPDRARLTRPDVAPVEYQGTETRNEPLRERLWRGRTAAGGDLVVFLRDAACSDGMSDVTHPVIARVSLPEGGFLAGCCRVPAGQTESATALESTSWRLASLPGQPPAVLSSLKRGVTARFEAGRVTGFAGCNNFTGPYTLKGNSLTVGVLAGTMMACPEPAMSLERAFHAALTGTHSYAISGERLSLTTGAGARLMFEKEAAVTLEGGSWEVTGFNNGRQAVVSPMVGTVRDRRLRERSRDRPVRVQHVPRDLFHKRGPHHDRARRQHTHDVRRRRDDAGTAVPEGPGISHHLDLRRRPAPSASGGRRARARRAAAQVGLKAQGSGLKQNLRPRTRRSCLSLEP